MPAAYSIDLRHRAVSAYRNKHGNQEAVAALFLISPKPLQNYLYLERETGSLVPRQTKRGPSPVLQEARLQVIASWVRETPDMTLAELCERYQKTQKVRVSVSTMCRACQRLELTRKKKSPYASEQDRPDIKKARRFYRSPGRLVGRKPHYSG